MVELSIVLVIIGLLIGGIMVAQSMISTVKVQRLLRDLQQYEVSVTNFKTNYKQIPGDSAFFMPPGNADNTLSSGGPCMAPPHNTYNSFEGGHFWAHLSQARMIDKEYVAHLCTADHNQSLNAVSNAGLLGPSTDISNEVRGIWGGLIIPYKDTAVVNLRFSIKLDADMVMPLQLKYPPVANPTTSGGLVNVNADPAMQCLTSSHNEVSCLADTAVYGVLNYYLPNLN